MEIILQLILGIIILIVTIILGYTTIKGAPYAPLGKEKIEIMIKLLNIKRGDHAVDLGSGDGRIVIEMAKKGCETHGYEINPLLVLISRYKIKKAGLENNAFIHLKSYWKEDIGNFNVVALFGAPHIMKRLENKFKKELKPGTLITSNYFQFPNLHCLSEDRKIYLYKI